MSISINFVDRNSDLDTLNKSYESLPVEQQQELEKALKKDGLVLVDVQVQGKHGVYTRKQWKKASDVKKNEGKSSKGAPDADKQKAIPQVIKGKHMSDLRDNLKEHGFVLDSIHSKGIHDDEEVIMYDKDKNTYTAKANVYSDGGVELRRITKEKKEETVSDNDKQHGSGNLYPTYVNKTKVGVPKAHSSSYFSEKKAIEFAKQLHDNGATNIEISSAEDAFNQTQYRVAWDKEEKKQSNAKAGNNPTKKADAPSKAKQDSSSTVGVPKTKADIQSLLASGKSRNDIIEIAKKSGISWKENAHEGINWMRCCMAMIGKGSQPTKPAQPKATKWEYNNGEIAPSVADSIVDTVKIGKNSFNTKELLFYIRELQQPVKDEKGNSVEFQGKPVRVMPYTSVYRKDTKKVGSITVNGQTYDLYDASKDWALNPEDKELAQKEIFALNTESPYKDLVRAKDNLENQSLANKLTKNGFFKTQAAAERFLSDSHNIVTIHPDRQQILLNNLNRDIKRFGNTPITPSNKPYITGLKRSKEIMEFLINGKK